MAIDLDAATAFLATHGRVLDRRRLAVLLGDGEPDDVLAAVEAYRNSDGGYGWGLEPDLRSPGSQPAGALHALQAFADAAPVVTPRAVRLCDWLTSVSLPDGGLPFALPVTSSAGCAPWWATADPHASSLQITAAVAAQAHRLAGHDPAVAAHPWLTRATDLCLAQIAGLGEHPHAYVLAFSLQLVDAMGQSAASRLAAGLAAHLPPSATLPVAGGTADERLRPLDFSPRTGRPSRAFIATDVIDADLQRLAGLQQPDGGWTVDFAAASPAASLEWRGYATVGAIATLLAHGLA